MDGVLVTEGKTLLFIREVVEPRGNRRRDFRSGPLSSNGIEGYVKPIVDLYKTQLALGLTTHPHPRGNALQEILKH